MEVLGKVHLIGQSIAVTQSYEKRELVVKTDEQYPQLISIEFGQGKCNEYIDKLKLGDEVKIAINLGGREWTNPQGETKYFNSIKGWKVEKTADASTPQPSAPMPPAQAHAFAPAIAPATIINKAEPDDLPF